MLCLECGAEMHLVQVVEDTTMFVSGYEHQTWLCSGCSSVERRMTFTRKKRQTPHSDQEPTHVASVEPTQTVAVQPIQSEPMEPAPIVPIQVTQTAPAEPTPTAPAETTVPVKAIHEPGLQQPNHPHPPAAVLQTDASSKTFDEKLRYLTRRATALREAAAESKRHARFNRYWDKLRSVPSLGFEALSHKDRDEPVQSPEEPATAPAPAAHDEPIPPASERTRRWSWRKWLR